MKVIPKRTKGKVTKCLAIRDMYKYYKANCKPNEPIEPYKEFSRVIKACNRELVNQITRHSEIVLLPYRFGTLGINKYERSFDKSPSTWPIDWKATNENGFTVYHDQEFSYKWTWCKTRAIVINKSKYKFIACREAKRKIPYMLKTFKLDYI